MLACISLLIWLYLYVFHGRFWSSTPELGAAVPGEFPDVDIIVPARDEAQTIERVIGSLTSQEYAGNFTVILVDDNSTDGTGELAGRDPRLKIVRAAPKPCGWSGKMWAVSQGIAVSRASILLFTDADIAHDPRHLASLVAHMQAPSSTEPPLNLVSEMVHLNCESLAERALVPAFVYFFQMLFPFAKVNDPRSRVAAAAGGTVLIRRDALEEIGGIGAIKNALIDDVALAKAVKGRAAFGRAAFGRAALGRAALGRAAQGSHRIYLGHSGLAASIRPYPHFGDMWRMISRTAFTQLRYSVIVLTLTVLGMMLVWLVPVAAVFLANGWARASGMVACGLSLCSYLPTLRRYRRSPLWALALPVIALFYMAATVASALDHWRGAGARWKNRAYGGG